MDVGFQSLADHPDRVANTLLRVHQKFVREDVEDLAIFRESDVARGIDGAAHIFTFDIARTMPEGDTTTAIHATNEVASFFEQGGVHRNVGDPFGFFDGAANGTYG